MDLISFFAANIGKRLSLQNKCNISNGNLNILINRVAKITVQNLVAIIVYEYISFPTNLNLNFTIF